MLPARRSKWRGAGPRAPRTQTRRPWDRRPGGVAAASMHHTPGSGERGADRLDLPLRCELAAVRRSAPSVAPWSGGRLPPDDHNHGALILTERIHVWVAERNFVAQVMDLVRASARAAHTCQTMS
eukprot:CAMPEP_0181220910 /NCGR_PEP_ID=MMETSP1096-20121128/29097_1 /TAXON_ID=156174 ORGANISM="Chrysochromulina ericina, Strain CCMP281" /NCGR_SAMPLE_ID=MMETSP1096 /ASSEMBLY_ACC=CAM_ASM_000453 /LENGTH=124 /DNA_ID=CAMNT_0023313461 /DNA_START=302 /DNA_END=677 /DNA_ORIENTATION=+